MSFEVPPGSRAWLVIFHRRSTSWVERITPGRWKHVSAVGFVPQANAWAALSWELGRMRVAVIPDVEFLSWLAGWAGEGPGILRVRSPDFDTGPWRPRLLSGCVPMICHLLGLRGGALLPDQLWRLLRANGAEIANDGRPLCTEVTRGDDFAAGEGATAGG